MLLTYMSLCIRVFLHICITIHSLFHTCMSLYIRSIRIYYSIYESLFIYVTLHSLSHTNMSLYIRSIHIYVPMHTSLSTHICYYTFTFPYIHVTVHTLHIYLSPSIRVALHMCYYAYAGLFLSTHQLRRQSVCRTRQNLNIPCAAAGGGACDF